MKNKTAIIPGGATIWARQTIESEIFYNKPHAWFKIWFYLVNRASHQDSERFKRGECFVQYGAISDDVGVSVDVVKKCMGWLKRRGSISTKRSTRGANVILINYDYYQDLDNYEYKNRALEKAPEKPSEKHQDGTLETPAKHSDIQELNNEENDNNKERNTNGPSGQGLNVFDPKNNITNWEVEVEESAGAHLNKAMALFKPIFPGEFAGKKNVFEKQTTRDVVEAMLERYTLSDLEEIVRIYDLPVIKSDPYRPQARSIHEFCTTKLAVIENYFYRLHNDEWFSDKHDEIIDSCWDEKHNEEYMNQGMSEGEIFKKQEKIYWNRPWIKENKS